MSAARFAGWNPFTVLTWGFAPKASLHPRLYAFACFAGWDAHFVLKKTLAPQKSCQESKNLAVCYTDRLDGKVVQLTLGATKYKVQT